MAPVTADTTAPARVAVVIPCHKQAHFLPATVASVCAQTFADLEIVIVDDGSPDDTSGVAERLMAVHPERTIRLLRQANQGLGASRNNGIVASSAEYVVALDADDILGPNYIEDCVRELDARPDVSIAYGSLRLFGEESGWYPVSDYDFSEFTRRNPLTCTALYRRRAFTEVGGYDIRLTAYEDWDFWLGCGELGHVGAYVPQAVFFYRKRRSGMLAGARERDTRLKAQLVLNHPALFSLEQAEWARAVLEDRADPSGADTQLGHIPAIGETPVQLRRSGGAFAGARRFATLVTAGDLLEREQLLVSYCALFSGDDDASLVIYGSEEQLAGVTRIVDELGLDRPDAADLLGVVADDVSTSLADAASRVDAMLTLVPYPLPVPVPRVDESRVSELRALSSVQP